MTLRWTPGQVVRKTIWADGLFTLTIRAPEVKPFEPGQFLQLALEGTEKLFHRPYSVASPHGSHLDFFIVLVQDGELTPLLWQLEVGDAVQVSEQAAGSFTLSHVPDGEDLWLVATGTGIAPYVAMLRTDSTWERFRRIYLVHGVRHPQDLAYQMEFAQHAQSYPDRFRYLSVVSRSVGSGTLSGRITQCLANGSLEEAAGTTFAPQKSVVMLCGNPDMLTEMQHLLEEKGLQKHRSKSPGQIVVERYW